MIREILKKLNTEDRARLMYAFEQDISIIITLEDDYYIGVNAIRDDIIERQGKFIYGRIA